MANSQVTQEIIKALNLNVNRENVPNPIPVVEVGVKLVKNAILKSVGRTSSGTGTIYTTPANQDFYLTGIVYSLVKDVTCDIGTGASHVTATIDGASVNLLSISTLNLTVQNQTITLILTHPLKIDRNTAISFGGAYTAGTCSRSANITGFIDETGQA